MSDIEDKNPEKFINIQKNELKKDIIKVASFNMERLGEYHKDYKALSEIISQFDLVGCIEVFNVLGIKNLMKYLNDPKWSYHISKTNTGTKSYKEYFAYIWDNTKVKMILPLGFFSDKNNEFVRDPYACLFKAGNMDFTFVILHIVYGKSIKDREAEISHLDEIYSYFENLANGDRDIIIAGDFNDGDVKDFSNLKKIDSIVDVIPEGTKTTIGKKGLASEYDHIFVSKYSKGDLVLANEDNYVKGENFIYDKKRISDHVPVYFELNLKNDTDNSLYESKK